MCDHNDYHFGILSYLYLPYWFVIKQFLPDPQIRVTKRLPDMFFPIYWGFKGNKITQGLLPRISPVNFQYGGYVFPKDLQYEWSRLVTHDRNTNHFKRLVTKAGFEKMSRDIGYRDPDVFVSGR